MKFRNSAMLMICHEPLYLKNLVHHRENPLTRNLE